MKHAKRHPLIFGTIILTATGLITRVIGFFYRIYLSRLFGEAVSYTHLTLPTT